MKHLSNSNNFQNFELNLTDINLGENTQNFHHLTQGIKHLPNNLQQFKLYLSENNLALNNPDNFKILT